MEKINKANTRRPGAGCARGYVVSEKENDETENQGVETRTKNRDKENILPRFTGGWRQNSADQTIRSGENTGNAAEAEGLLEVSQKQDKKYRSSENK